MTNAIGAAACVVLCVAAVGAQRETSLTRDLKLQSGANAFTSVTLTNTHSRTYTDPTRPPSMPPAPPMPNTCALDAKAAGVVWKVVLHGASVAAKEISVADAGGRELPQVCWSSSGGVFKIDAMGNRIGGGPQTEFFIAAPEDVTQFAFRYGASGVVVAIGK